MARKLFQRKANTFQVSVGEEGAVVVYTQGGYAKSKLFVKSPEPTDTEKLRELLSQDKDAMVYIYIDTLDQSYVQRSLPAVSAMGIGKIAQKHLEKEVPKGHIKSCVQIGRAPTGRHDWIYTFISSGMEPPISTWIDFFLPFHNVIAGIYFLPVEIYSVVTKLKYLAQKENQFQEKSKKTNLEKFFANFKAKDPSAVGRWEVYLSQNKTGGFRQAAFQDGKIIFSRLLNNINDPSPDVVAGNIEQEIANSIEYMSRLSLGTEQEVDVYLVLSTEVLRYLRKEKIKATNLFTYTPFELANKIKVTEAAAEKDKFADPTILTVLSKVKTKIITLHTPATSKVYNATQAINYTGFFFIFLIPVLLILSMYYANNIVDLKASIVQVQNQAISFQAQLNEQTKRLSTTESKIQDPLTADHIIEIVEVNKFFDSIKSDPIDIVAKLSNVIPPYARAKVIKWNFDDQVLLGFKSLDKTSKHSVLGKTRSYNIEADFEIIMRRTGSSYEELEQKYTGFTQEIIKTFSDYDISISDLPQSISFQDINTPVAVVIKIKYPATKKGVVSRTSPAPQVQIQQSTPKPMPKTDVNKSIRPDQIDGMQNTTTQKQIGK